ncbi:alanine racemase [Clostridium novyi B str. ATCC 27606]|uniref:Alanine racemase n=2 Tax=Clostridium TaxID=1485 RepID=A0AA40M547_CLONO|nr:MULTISPECIES: alanine racemase [Clostridium]KEI13528.1 alanine racemase [Clostridium novyi B str. NCTC 9691]KEI14812.1 alanine racemase [Clostridium novyi B str. ATCC 27606]KEI16660.1 alanine racemase [Clostridium haemolyticum NCTC 9693]KGN04119.1 alanine racemase [Clostridium haemolyticum NCTC 8350]CAG7839479.1 Alanine racemase 1 [Clostridium haemolyticum]
MFKHLRPVWAEINLDNLASNMKEIKKISSSKKIIGIVKADAYGHGALDVAPTLIENGATGLAVAVINEGVELRRSGIECPIMVLGFTAPTLIDTLLRHDIEQTVFSLEYAKQLSEVAEKMHKKIKIHIAVDTGMGRIGFLPNKESVQDVKKISKLPNVEIKGIFTHFSTADESNKEYTYYQLKKFNEFYDELKKENVNIETRHIANSAAIMELSETQFEGVRPGIILYGYYPSDEVDKSKLKLKPVMELKTNIVHIKKISSGQYISYGRKFKTKRESIIATLPVGYADGYTRLLFNKAKVIINGQFAPIIGRICMDQCMVDITDIKGDVKLGDEVILMGQENGIKIDADDIASMLGTINYEVVCMISKRVPRVYIKNGEVVKVRNYI